MTQEQIKHMVDRFLQWKLPEDFYPDCGITYKGNGTDPIGTNLLTATQAKEMIEFMLEGLPKDIPHDR